MNVHLTTQSSSHLLRMILFCLQVVIGSKFVKAFAGLGNFAGCVRAFDGTQATVKYEDGDSEVGVG